MRRGIKVVLGSANTVAAQNGLKVLSGLEVGDEVVVSGNLLMQQIVAATKMSEEISEKSSKSLSLVAPAANDKANTKP